MGGDCDGSTGGLHTNFRDVTDPDDIYEAPAYPDKPRPLTRMETIEAEAPKAMAQIMERYGMMG